MAAELIGGRYRIIRPLAVGGMGEVFLAENVPLGRREVLKVLSRHLASQERFRARFRREARATERLQHPNIVAVQGSGEMGDGRHFLALEYVEGETLEQTLARDAPLPLALAVGFIEQLADAIGYGHACGVVHRDIKPANVIRLKNKPDSIKVLDFGLAKILARDEGMEESLVTPHGLTLGTPPYMAPEQLTGGAIGAWTDVYAIGCVAFELLAGRPPFTGDAIDIMRQQVMDPPPALRSLRRGEPVPPPLEALVMSCLQKDPTRRPKDAAVVIEELRDMSTLRTEHVPADDPHTHRDPMQVAVLASSSSEQRADPYHKALCKLAEALIDLGDTDADLSLVLADAGDLGAQLARVETALHAARQRGTRADHISELEAASAERRASLAAAQAQLDRLVSRRATTFAHEPMVARLVGELALTRKRRVVE